MNMNPRPPLVPIDTKGNQIPVSESGQPIWEPHAWIPAPPGTNMPQRGFRQQPQMGLSPQQFQPGFPAQLPQPGFVPQPGFIPQPGFAPQQQQPQQLPPIDPNATPDPRTGLAPGHPLTGETLNETIARCKCDYPWLDLSHFQTQYVGAGGADAMRHTLARTPMGSVPERSQAPTGGYAGQGPFAQQWARQGPYEGEEKWREQSGGSSG